MLCSGIITSHGELVTGSGKLLKEDWETGRRME
jgi:hypothetical protein